MAKTLIEVNKQTVLEFLSTGKKNQFVIPDYQRPYAWGKEQVETLFSDIWDFALNLSDEERETATYFLGSAVLYENENGEQEIIDGQQRITSLFLLLRAIYTKIKNDESKEAQNFKGQIETAIWKSSFLTKEVDFSSVLLTSKVVDNSFGNDVLQKILETGETDPKATDNYSKNYLLFLKMFEEYSKNSVLSVFYFIHALLNQAILLPVNAGNQDTALTVFSTLNDRGMQLNDSDIFKAKIYNHLKTAAERADFIEHWKSLEKGAADAKFSMYSLFYNYMFYLRALDNDLSTTTSGLRKYYLSDKCRRLYRENLMSDLETVLSFWKVVNANYDIPEEIWDNNPKIRKAIATLTDYPNEFWRYLVITYFLQHRKNPTFEKDFLLFLNKLTYELLTHYILYPYVNYVKLYILKLNAKIICSPHPEFEFTPVDFNSIKNEIITPWRSITRMLLKMYAYKHQDNLLPADWQIEHILPQKWKDSFFTDVEPEEVDKLIEHIGNKTPFEMKLNIQASNGYFKEKQSKYRNSKIAVTQNLALTVSEDWTLKHIEQRDELVLTEILDLLRSWQIDYSA